MAKRSRKIFNLPNAITATRIAAVPVLFLLLADPSKGGSLFIAVLFATAMLTDLLDGYVARKYNSITVLGRFMDPIADKLLINTAMIILVSLTRLDAWIAAVMIIRDLLLEGTRATAATEGKSILVSSWGKQKTVAQSFGLTALILHYPLFGINMHLVGTVVIYIALVMSVFSGIGYLLEFYQTTLEE